MRIAFDLIAASALLLLAADAFAQTGMRRPSAKERAACEGLWVRALKDSNDTLSPVSAEEMIVNMGAVDRDEDGNVSNREFMSACHAGLVSSPQPSEIGSSAISKAP